MRIRRVVVSVAVCVGPALCMASPGWAVESDSIALRAGETADLGSLYWVSNCHSELKGPPTAEVMDGPAELSVSVKAQSVTPRKQNCAAPVAGGELSVTASKEIKSRLEGKLFVRVNYPTKDGNRQKSREIDYVLFPEQAASPAVTPAASTPAKAP